MTKFRSGLIGVAVIGGLLSLTPSAAWAETAAQRAACSADASRICASAMPNEDAVIACLRSKKSQLSPGCRQAFEPSAAQRAACTSDAFRICFSALSSEDAVIACLRSKKAQLSPGCRQAFDRI